MRCLPALLVVAFACLAAPGALPQVEPELESYTLVLGCTPETVTAVIKDGAFGRGTARSRVVTRVGNGGSRKIVLEVSRTVAPGEITFALLVFCVRVRCYDADGDLVHSEDLEGFIFGDSASGSWRAVLRTIPADASRIRIKFFGNYE